MLIKLKNLNIHYKVLGKGDPIILLHGWGGNIDYLAKLSEHVSRKFTVYVLDLPGFGLSTLPEEIWDSAEYANLVKGFIAELQIINPILLGHSFGGKIAINLAADDSIKTSKLILVDSSGIKLPKSWRIQLKIYFFKLMKLLAKLPIIKNIYAAKMELYRQKFGSNDYKNATPIMRAILVKTLQENVVMLLPKIKKPTLLIWGEKDTDTPLAAGRIMQQGILGSQLKVISSGGHFPFLDNWEGVAKAIDDFLN